MKKELKDKKQEIQNTDEPSLESIRRKASMITESIRITQRATPYYNTQCLTCTNVCRENCCLSNTIDLMHIVYRGCDRNKDRRCTNCSHDYTRHVHVNCLYNREIIRESLLTETERQKLDAATSAEQQKQIIIKRLNQRIEEKNQQVAVFKDELKSTLQDLQGLCPYYDYRVELQCAIKLLEEAELVKDKQITLEELRNLRDYFENLIQTLDGAKVI